MGRRTGSRNEDSLTALFEQVGAACDRSAHTIAQIYHGRITRPPAHVRAACEAAGIQVAPAPPRKLPERKLRPVTGADLLALTKHELMSVIKALDPEEAVLIRAVQEVRQARIRERQSAPQRQKEPTVRRPPVRRMERHPERRGQLAARLAGW